MIPQQLDSVRVRARSSTLNYSAVVLDLNNQPVAGAEVVAMGITNKLVTDSLGRFSLAGLGKAALTIRLRKMGYQATVESIRMLTDRADTIRMPRLALTLSKVEINERSGFGNDYWNYRELDQRQRWKGAMAGVVSREELDARGKQDLCDALPATPSGVKLALHNDPYCKDPEKGMKMLLIDGGWCRQGLLSDYLAADVEMVEVLPGLGKSVNMGGDNYGGSLAARGCGGAGGRSAKPTTGNGAFESVTVTVYGIWLRKPELSTKAIVPKPRTIVGVVFDSIAQRPLAGAHVTLVDRKRETVADSLGAFRFDSVASGVHELKVDHETLRQLGLPPLRDTVDLVPELVTNVSLTIPSFATLWKRVCEDSVPPRPSEGLVYGRVLLGAAAVASTDMSGTVVEASWLGATPDSAGDPDARKQVFADSAGNYAACGVPTAQPLTLSSLAHGTATVSVSFTIGDARIARRDLILPAAGIVDRLVADSTGTPPLTDGEGSTITGIVRDSLGKPVNDAHVAVTGVTGEWRTNERGRFVVRGIPGGARVVTSSQLGFAPERRLVDVSGADSLAVDLSMSRVSTYLDTLKITGKQSLRTSTLLDIASRRKLGVGYFEDSTKLAKTPGTGLRDVFNFPSVRTGPPPSAGQSGSGRGHPPPVMGVWYIFMTSHAASIMGAANCVPTIYVDGMSTSMQYVNDLTKEEIGLIEVFTSPSRAPVEYAGSGGNCGIVLIWRKTFLRP
ncbi:MAG: carboxypeptidase regulatory-like domain-containing protein [Gemmatimonadaceae bacterium]